MMYMAKCSNPGCCVPEHYPRGHKLQAVISEWNHIHSRRGPLPTIGGQMVQKMLEQVEPDGAFRDGPEPGGEESK